MIKRNKQRKRKKMGWKKELKKKGKWIVKTTFGEIYIMGLDIDKKNKGTLDNIYMYISRDINRAQIKTLWMEKEWSSLLK